MKKIICLLFALVFSCSVVMLAACNRGVEKLPEQNEDDIDYSQFDENTTARLKISIQSYDNEEALIRSVAEVFQKKISERDDRH